MNVFDFFSVAGSFEFVQSRGSVKLSDGSTIDADLVTLGGANVMRSRASNSTTANKSGSRWAEWISDWR